MDILNSPLYKVLDRITNLFFLNVLWLLSSLPLITIFPATAAMFGVFKDWTEGKEEKLFKSYLRHFKNNFKHSFVYGILWLLIIAIFYIDLRIINDFETYNFILMSLLFLLFILFAFNTIYFVPISIHFKLTLFGKVKNSFLFSIMFFPTTILCILIGVVAFLIAIFIPAFMIIIFSPAGYGIFRLCYRTFEKVGKYKN
ncbi:MAG TPA: DUF624 domain-containing protein [Virgibacillus sp.]|nr:DUF624 domain-containing protein [Virgibacillus sp.]HLR68172.1 DUF624 domain-containing protein [Virgibacillus sp.]